MPSQVKAVQKPED